MNPLFHLSSFFFGICMAIVYVRFRKDRGNLNAISKSFTNRVIERMRYDNSYRYMMYMSGITIMYASVLW